MATTPTLEWTRLLGTGGSDHGKALTTGPDGAIYMSESTPGSLDGQTPELQQFLTRRVLI
jgi:hypothetical protein